MSTIRTVCVYCGSGPGTDPAFIQAARRFGEILAREKVGLVYGGGSVGMMGAVAAFVLLAGASMLLTTLLALEATPTGFDMHRVLAINVPVMSYGRTPDQITGFYKETMRLITTLPGVDGVAVGTVVPWRDAGTFGPGFAFSDGRVPTRDEEAPRARFRTVSPGFFASV